MELSNLTFSISKTTWSIYSYNTSFEWSNQWLTTSENGDRRSENSSELTLCLSLSCMLWWWFFNPILRGHSWWLAMPSVASAFYSLACDARKCAHQFLARIFIDLSGEKKILKIGPQEAEISPCVKSFEKRPRKIGLKLSLLKFSYFSRILTKDLADSWHRKLTVKIQQDWKYFQSYAAEKTIMNKRP